jgi:SAM-dependent methyltransferase
LDTQVCTIDVRRYPLKHPDLVVIQGDLTKTPFQNDTLDVVIAVSALEHIGLGFYGDPSLHAGIEVAIREIHRILKIGGKLVLTMPFDRKRTFTEYRREKAFQIVYSAAYLEELLSPFVIKGTEYFITYGTFMTRSSFEQLEKVEYGKSGRKTFLCLIAEKS